MKSCSIRCFLFYRTNNPIGQCAKPHEYITVTSIVTTACCSTMCGVIFILFTNLLFISSHSHTYLIIFNIERRTRRNSYYLAILLNVIISIIVVVLYIIKHSANNTGICIIFRLAEMVGRFRGGVHIYKDK